MLNLLNFLQAPFARERDRIRSEIISPSLLSYWVPDHSCCFLYWPGSLTGAGRSETMAVKRERRSWRR